jgi:hypothetical protein
MSINPLNFYENRNAYNLGALYNFTKKILEVFQNDDDLRQSYSNRYHYPMFPTMAQGGD